MEEKIKELLSLIRKERVLMLKMIESDERDDSLLFSELQKKYKVISTEVNNKIRELINDETYEKVYEKLGLKINELAEKDKDPDLYIVLLGLVNSTYKSIIGEKYENVNSDVFTNELTSTVYGLYLWHLKENDFTKEFRDSFRNDMAIKFANSRVLRLYFAGDYEGAKQILNQSNSFDEEDRNGIGAIFVSLLGGKISITNSYESFNGLMDDVSFNSGKEMLKLEFCAISLMMMKHRIILPIPPVDYSDFTEELIKEASLLTNKYNKMKKEEKEEKEEKQKIIRL